MRAAGSPGTMFGTPTGVCLPGRLGSACDCLEAPASRVAAVSCCRSCVACAVGRSQPMPHNRERRASSERRPQRSSDRPAIVPSAYWRTCATRPWSPAGVDTFVPRALEHGTGDRAQRTAEPWPRRRGRLRHVEHIDGVGQMQRRAVPHGDVVGLPRILVEPRVQRRQRWRLLEHHPIRPHRRRRPIVALPHLESALMHGTVMPSTQQHEVAEAGGPAVDPMLHVMRVAAARRAARYVARQPAFCGGVNYVACLGMDVGPQGCPRAGTPHKSYRSRRARIALGGV